MTTLTRAERRDRNRRAHAIRTAMVAEDWATAKREGLPITWRAISDQYAALDTDTVLTMFGDGVEVHADVVPVEPVAGPPMAKRDAPAWIAALSVEYRLARESWEAGLEAAVAGGHTRAAGGRPANGETYPDEERDYRDAHPAPVWKEFLRARAAEMRAAREDVTV